MDRFDPNFDAYRQGWQASQRHHNVSIPSDLQIAAKYMLENLIPAAYYNGSRRFIRGEVGNLITFEAKAIRNDGYALKLEGGKVLYTNNRDKNYAEIDNSII